MKLICLNDSGSQRITFTLNLWTHLVLPAFALSVLLIALFMLIAQPVEVTRQVEEAAPVAPVVATEESTAISAEDLQKIDVEILARRLGVLEAESLRLNAFGSRIVKMARLDPEEFAFDSAPSQGGVKEGHEDEDGYGISADELMQSVRELEKQLLDQRNRLEGMIHVLNGRILEREVKPDGMPVAKGYISSRYGFRRDPFNGKRRMHKGVDFAGKHGSEIYSVAGGIVLFTGRKGGYGKVIEIDHGDGLISRYAHLHKISVSQDQVIKKGQVIAQLGNTGRSTGPHLHLEVLKNGRHEDPAKYF